MCPPAPTAWHAPHHGIDIDENDEDMVMHLWRMIDGNPPPQNVLTGINPYIFAPWNLPENMLYFFIPEDHMSPKDGYWKPTEQDHRILENSPVEGRRTTLEFYQGKAPYGVKTDWVMHEYGMIQRAQNSSFLLCRVVHNVVSILNHEEHDEGGQQDIGGVLLENLPNEDNDLNSHDPTNAPQMVNRRENGQVEDSDRNLQNMRLHFPTEVPDEAIDYVLREEYMELNDLIDSPFSSSENTSAPSMSSDDYFDSDALLRDLENADNNGTEQPDLNYNFNVATSHAPNEVFITPPLSGTLCNNSNDLQSKENTASAPAPGEGKALKHVSSLPELSLCPSTSTSIVTRTEGSCPSRIAKIAKKYCCFMAF